MAPHFSTLAWKIPWTEGPGGLQSMGSLGVGHDWATSLYFFTFMHWRRKWQPTPVFLPGESQGQRSLMDYSPWDCKDSDMTEQLSTALIGVWLYTSALTVPRSRCLLMGTCISLLCCCSVVARLWPHGLQPTRLLCPLDLPGKNTGVGCHFLLQGIFLTQGQNPPLLHRQVDSFPLSHLGGAHYLPRDAIIKNTTNWKT